MEKQLGLRSRRTTKPESGLFFGNDGWNHAETLTENMDPTPSRWTLRIGEMLKMCSPCSVTAFRFSSIGHDGIACHG